ncbi:hypothetical protein ABID21_000950 [Pseudorhizobium tarimense]|uniref:Uncharacterized protein n=1 Tax=Pseudorhizobium tarimense TaxID=1079109 RepID=A0ABV2H2R3_9HYPH|nr:hypothetical protein [Pseudorhizobium tarimense]MCJ8518155.1 hypothetical protein [Pseudorhizobium tarimense]
MKKSLAAIAVVLLLLQNAAWADQSTLCQSLNRRLVAIPEVIGSTSEVRRHAEALRSQEDEIRYLRSEMRRAGCGAGSIVSFGRSGDMCSEMKRELRQAEAERDAIRSRRAASVSMVRPNGERNAILSAMQQNRCFDEVVALPDNRGAEPQIPPGPSLPGRSSSSITDVKANTSTETAEAPLPPPPERAYDPSQKVRTVGPVFLPNDSSIDLANPASDGARPRQ